MTLVTSALNPGEGEGITTAYSMIRALARKGVRMIDRAKIVRFQSARPIWPGSSTNNVARSTASTPWCR